MNGHRQFDGFSDPGMTPRAPMPIAIVGMACRMPGSVATPAEFWELCSRARSGYTKVPKERFNHDLFYHPNPGKTGAYHAQGGNFLDVDLAAFDAPFFGLTEKEAISMDPQQRLLLECTFEALENAGVPKHSIVGKDVGVFVGGSFAEYESHLFRDSDTIPMHQATGKLVCVCYSWLLLTNQAAHMLCSPTGYPTFSISEAPASPPIPHAPPVWWLYILLARVYGLANPHPPSLVAVI